MNRAGVAREVVIAGGGTQTRLERLGDWFAAEYEGLLRFALLISGDSAAAEDLVHDAFVRLYRADRHIEISGFRAYSRRTILNLQRSAFRRLRSERRAIAAHGVEDATQPASPAPEVWKAILALPGRQRACVVLRYYEDMTDAEIAEVLGVGHGTVKKAMHRGMSALRARLGDEE